MKKIPKRIEKPQDLRKWFIKFRLRNGLEECYPISSSEKEHLWNVLPEICEEKGLEFFEFNSKAHRILVQSSQLIFFQFLFEPLSIPYPKNSDEDANDADSYAVKIYCADNPKPLVFHVDIDEPDPNDEGNQGEMNNFLFYASHIYDKEQWLNFTDEDGETAFFRGTNIALAEIPLKVLQEEEIFCDELSPENVSTCTIH